MVGNVGLRVLICVNFHQGQETSYNLFNVPDGLLPVGYDSESKDYQTVIVNDKKVSATVAQLCFAFL